MSNATSIRSRDFVSEDPKTVTLANILHGYRGEPPMRTLVVGCGSGAEAAVLAQHLNISVTGIDIVPDFDRDAMDVVDLRKGDATGMEFDDCSFDFVYSFHALEHIPEYRKALHEIRRVLKPDGGYMIGTPNRTRLIGYLGSRDTPLSAKLKWNLDDWSARLRGQFRNELGAHAGYSAEELRDELTRVFSTAIDISPEYYLQVYRNRKRVVSALLRTGTSRWLFPAVYFCGVR